MGIMAIAFYGWLGPGRTPSNRLGGALPRDGDTDVNEVDSQPTHPEICAPGAAIAAPSQASERPQSKALRLDQPRWVTSHLTEVGTAARVSGAREESCYAVPSAKEGSE